MPIDVTSINTMTAVVMYTFIKRGARLQLAFNQLAQTSLATSNADPITIIGITAAEKIAAKPTTEQQIATAEIVKPVSSSNQAKIIVTLFCGASCIS